jgi:LPS-assembly protein
MTSRIRLIITATVLSHLLLLATAVTSQTTPAAETPKFNPPGVQTPPVASVSEAQKATAAGGSLKRPMPGEEVTIRAKEQEKNGNVYKLSGDVEIFFRDFSFRADEMEYNSDTGDLKATGHIVLDGGPHDEHITATKAVYNLETENGMFYDVVGMIGIRTKGKSVVLTSSDPFIFTGKRVEKAGRDRFIVNNGSVTTCKLPNPKWTFRAEKVDVVVGEDAKMYHSNFRIKNIPIFYFPYVQHPVDNLGRQSGFLIPTTGNSNSKGFILGESYYWAINRSMDATVGAEYYSARGWAQHGQFRARPSERSYIDATYFGVMDRGAPNTGQDQGGENAKLNAELELPSRFRAVASVEYLSSFVFRLAFSDTFTQAVNSEVKSVAFITKNFNGFSLNGNVARYQNFLSTTPGDQILILHMPTLDVSSRERTFIPGLNRLMGSFDVTVGGVSRREPGFVTSNLVGRFDLNPRISLPLVFKGWGLRPEIGLRDTFYTERLTSTGAVINPSTGVGTPITDALNRKAAEASFELNAPSLSRIFEKPVFGRKLKHVVQPQVTYRYVTGVNNFSEIIRFDERDILSNTSELEARVVNRIYAKRSQEKQAECVEPEAAPKQTGETHPGEMLPGTATVPARCDTGTGAREIVSWEVKQKYFMNQNFGNALVPGTRNVLSTTVDFAGIAFLTEPRRWSPVVSKLRVQTSPNTDVQWEMDYDFLKGRISSTTVFATHRIDEFFFGGSYAYLQVPGEIASIGGTTEPGPTRFNQYRLLLGYGHPNKRGYSAGASVGVDANLSFLQYGAAQITHNWDCCGFSVEYRRFALGSVRNENQFRFAFTLSNIGTFGNLRRQERLF